MTRPNIILVITDDQPVAAVTALAMPWLAAQTDWVVFPNATNNVPICGPSRGSVFTGQYARTHGYLNHPQGEVAGTENGLDPRRFLPFVMRRAGYQTCFVGKYQNAFPWDEGNTYQPPGWDDWHATLGAHHVDFRTADNGVVTDYTGSGEFAADIEAETVATAIGALREPFFLYWGVKAPHGTPPNGTTFTPATRHAASDVGGPVRLLEFNPASVATKPAWLRDAYPTALDGSTVTTYDARREGALRMMIAVDEGIEAVHDALVARGIDDNTIIVFWTDNSNLFGEHRHYSKAVPYEAAVNMQLRVRHPDVAGRTDLALVSNIDIAPTCADIAGTHLLTAPDGMSFLPRLLDGSANFRDAVLIERWEEDPIEYEGVGTWEGVRTATRKYVEYLAGDVELYSVADETVNEAGTDEPDEATLAATLATLTSQ